ncbi:MAG: competence/damage-inducible protein A [Longimicrobiales bacterium]
MVRAREVELLTIGYELLLGAITDENAAWLARSLGQVGIRVSRHTTVGDDPAAIGDALSAALARSGIALCSGGLGPTVDDVTRPAAAALFGRELRLDTAVLAAIRERFERRGRPMPEINRSQALVPADARVLPNSRGTAPGLVLEDAADRLAILLPGVPGELRGLFRDEVLPLLRARLGGIGPAVEHHVVRTTGIAESELAERVADLISDVPTGSVAFLPSWSGVDVRLTSWNQAQAAADAGVAEAVAARVAEHVYAASERDLAEVVGERLRHLRLSLAVAESCTGGLVAQRLTEAPGASSFLIAAIVAYANAAKERLLGVRTETLAACGAVSREVAREMADGARAVAGADIGIAVTGIAGPEGGSGAKPVGTVWLAATIGERSVEEALLLPGDRAEIRARAAQAVLALLDRVVRAERGAS